MSCIVFPCFFMSCCRSAMGSPDPAIFLSPLAQPASSPAVKPPMTKTAVHARRFMLPPWVEGAARRRSLPDLVRDRRDRLDVSRDRETIVLREVLVAGGGALDHLRHEATRHVAVRLVAGAEILGDLFKRPGEA